MKKYKAFIKSIVIVMFTQAFIYFILKNFNTEYNVMKTFLCVPLIKWFVYIYDFWYPFILFSAFIIFINDKKSYSKLIFTMIICAFLAHLTFLIYPTMVVRPDIHVKNFTDFVLDFTYKTDTPSVNCLPSVHCLYCFIMCFYIFMCNNLKKRYKIIMITFHILIVLSTVFIKQHIIEDIILSFIYVLIVIPFIYIFEEKLKKYLKFLF